MAKYIKCPRCRHDRVNVVQDNRGNVGHGMLGYMLTGNFEGAYTFSNTKKSAFQCARCGHIFKTVW